MGSAPGASVSQEPALALGARFRTTIDAIGASLWEEDDVEGIAPKSLAPHQLAPVRRGSPTSGSVGCRTWGSPIARPELPQTALGTQKALRARSSTLCHSLGSDVGCGTN